MLLLGSCLEVLNCITHAVRFHCFVINAQLQTQNILAINYSLSRKMLHSLEYIVLNDISLADSCYCNLQMLPMLQCVACRMNHGLRGSASPVLTATGLVNGRWRFSTPTESTPLNR